MKSTIQIIDDAMAKSEKDVDEKLDKMMELPLRHTNRNQGKQIRLKLLQVFNYWLQVDEEDLKLLCYAIQTGHVASLLIDDIQDDSPLRRGSPAAYTVYGIPKTILCVDSLLCKAMEKYLEQATIEQVRPVFQHFHATLLGQAKDMNWRDTGKCPTEEEYIKMIIGKTGRVFIGGLEVLNNLSKTMKINYVDIGVYLCLAFQITDDLNNLTNPTYFEQKGYCEDLEEGKFGFPVIHAIHSRPEDKRVMEIVQQRPKDYEKKRRCVELLQEFGSFEYTKKKIQLYQKLLAKELECLGPNPLLPELYAAIGNIY